jgi:hypothetical protein
VGVREILFDFLSEADPAVREIIAQVLLAEQRKIDLDRPSMKKELIDIIDAAARSETRR